MAAEPDSPGTHSPGTTSGKLRPQFSLTNLLWFITAVGLLFGSYCVGRQHADQALRESSYQDGANHVRSTELVDVTNERDGYKSETEQLRDYSQQLVNTKFSEWREKK